MTYYSTLLEAYGTENFEKKKKRKEKIVEENNNINIEEYKKDFEHCEPLQAPHYKLPISDKSLENYNNAYQVFLKERKIDKNESYNSEKTNENIVLKKNTNNPNNPNINIYNNFDKIKNDKINDIEPYYDEDLDSYLNINDFNTANIEIKQACDDDYKRELMTKHYELKTQDTFNYNDINSVMKKETKQMPNKEKKESSILQIQPPERPKVTQPPSRQSVILPAKDESIENKTNRPLNEENTMNREGYQNFNNEQDYSKYFYKNLINILLFIFIGILLIYLLDLLTELALHKGMKNTLDTLMPLIEQINELKK